MGKTDETKLQQQQQQSTSNKNQFLNEKLYLSLLTQ